jgi:metal-responsive CopG/Arc/MetJ family transcriptional regulator
MARRPITEGQVGASPTVTFVTSFELLRSVDLSAKSLGLSRSEWIRQAMTEKLEADSAEPTAA